jgi:hypothetical protein
LGSSADQSFPAGFVKGFADITAIRGGNHLARDAFLTAWPENPAFTRLWLAKPHQLWPVSQANLLF